MPVIVDDSARCQLGVHPIGLGLGLAPFTAFRCCLLALFVCTQLTIVTPSDVLSCDWRSLPDGGLERLRPHKVLEHGLRRARQQTDVLVICLVCKLHNDVGGETKTQSV